MTNDKTASNWFTQGIDNIRAVLPGGAVEQARALAERNDPERAKQMGETLLKYTLGGLGAGLSGSRLYHLVSELNRQQPKYTKFGPGAKSVDDEEKLASAEDVYNSVVSAPGKILQGITADQGTQDGLMLGAKLLGFTGAAYGGSQLMNALVAKKRKEDLKEQVEDAKKEYQRALISKKHAAALDAAFEVFNKTATEKQANPVWELMKLPFNVVRASGESGEKLYQAYIAAALGTGALSGKMMYDWTRARSKDKAFADAQKARARIAGVAPIHVDPEQMAALKQVAAPN